MSVFEEVEQMADAEPEVRSRDSSSSLLPFLHECGSPLEEWSSTEWKTADAGGSVEEEMEDP